VNCCLVSKSWIPRARKHLFADVRFGTKEELESWKETFPDPSTSPGRYAKTLTINHPHAVTVADAEVGGWIRDFSHVVHLELGSPGRLQGPYDDDESGIFLVPLQGLSPFVKSLSIDSIALPSSRIFDLILSFPPLEDLTVTNCYGAAINKGGGSNLLPTLIQPSNPPAFTGSLKLVTSGAAPIARQLLFLPGGIHFRKFMLAWEPGEDISVITALERCSHTLQSLNIACGPFGASILHLCPY